MRPLLRALMIGILHFTFRLYTLLFYKPAVPIRVQLWGYNSAFLPIFWDFESLGVYSGFNYFSGFNDFCCDFEILEVYSGFNIMVIF